MGIGGRGAAAAIIMAWLTIFEGLFVHVANGGRLNYKEALTKSLIFLEAQRSGKLPPNNRVPWRGNSALNDGKEDNVDLVGGYYDAGDNVKYGLPMAFTISTLSWAALFYQRELESAGELDNTRDAIRWGTDYLLKANVKPNTLYVQVGDPNKDHECWVRPENMQTPRTLLKIDAGTPGTEIAAETAAAMASASMVFRAIDGPYATLLSAKAEELFKFGTEHVGTFDGECPFYCSFSGFNDELLWAAVWLYKATKNDKYHQYIMEEAAPANVAEFSWDLKYAGSQVLLAELFFRGQKEFQSYKEHADGFFCSTHPASPFHQVPITPGGMVHFRDGANSQYVTGTAFLFSVYSDLLARYSETVPCGQTKLTANQVSAFGKKQMDYLLGSNPQNRSYMVGFGVNPPTQPHHRGASVPPIAANTVVDCGMSFSEWLNPNKPNPNELTGAIVGGPDKNDKFQDLRTLSSFTEPVTYCNSLAVGALANLAWAQK
ncbi:Endoglucanase [Heracleum sosnowskyi]|uniref:Endoglucanase n=1 Tax=Heracleum sosnowskyi TaxID=360622 RepID=A0AAD8ME09_9APIA|nr:Endoglucanase [Heracleum sosnowskyi]